MRNISGLFIALLFVSSCKQQASNFMEIRKWSVEDSNLPNRLEQIDSIEESDSLILTKALTISKRKFDSLISVSTISSNDFKLDNISVQKLAAKVVDFNKKNIEVTRCYIFTDSANYDFGTLVLYSPEYGILIKQSPADRKTYKLEELKIISGDSSKNIDTRALVESIVRDTTLTPLPPTLPQ